MRITKFNINGKHVSISLDDEYWADIPYEITFDYRLELGSIISDEDAVKILLDGEVYRAMIYASAYLAKYSATEKKMRDKLINKEYSRDAAVVVVAKMVEYGYINDRDYAERLVACKMRKLGKSRLKSELYAKGISREIISDVISETSDEEISENAIEVGSRWFNSHNLESREDEAKFYRFMQYRGYNFCDIKTVANLLKERNDDE